MRETFTINKRNIGWTYPTYFIAEISANHHQDFDHARRLIHAAKNAGADAVKLQTFTPDTITIDCDNEHFRIKKGTIWEGSNLYRLYDEAYMPWEWQPKLKQLSIELGLDFFSSPFDDTAVDFLENLQVPVYKVASFEIVDISLLRKIASTGKPIIMSTGMASLSEIDEAVQTIREYGQNNLALLKCTSAYPAPPEEMNLRTIPHLSKAFNAVVGLSDHSLGIEIPIAAVTLGARIIEKHFTLSRQAGGPDSEFSIEPQEFKSMVDSVRNVERGLGRVFYGMGAKEASSSDFRRSLFVVADVECGEVFTEINIRSIRPGYGLHPRYLSSVLGKHAATSIKRGSPLAWDLIA